MEVSYIYLYYLIKSNFKIQSNPTTTEMYSPGRDLAYSQLTIMCGDFDVSPVKHY